MGSWPGKGSYYLLDLSYQMQTPVGSRGKELEMSCWVGTKGNWTTARPTERAIGPQTKPTASFLSDPGWPGGRVSGSYLCPPQTPSRGMSHG